jgi:hypothetical protein
MINSQIVVVEGTSSKPRLCVGLATMHSPQQAAEQLGWRSLPVLAELVGVCLQAPAADQVACLRQTLRELHEAFVPYAD